MKINHLLNQFLGMRDTETLPVTASAGTDRIFNTPPRGLQGGVAADSILSMLLGYRGVGKMTTAISGYGGGAAFGVLGYKAYDSWKHLRNEITEMPSEAQFHQHGLDTSDVQPEEFELALVKVMIIAAKSGRHLSIEQQRKTMATIDSMLVDTEFKSLIFELLLRKISLNEISAERFSLPLKTEMYLAAFIVTGDTSDRKTWFLKQLANHLGLPPELVRQIQLQAKLEQRQAA